MLKVIAPAWIGLGFYRGVKLYNYNYNYNYNYESIEYEKKEDKKYDKKPIYFYGKCFGSGLVGGFLYFNPITIPITFSKEIYRLEVKLRGLNEEKNHKYYELL